MTKRAKKITHAGLGRRRPPAKMEILWDSECPGLGFRHYPSGKMTAQIMYRVRGDTSGKGGTSKARVLDIAPWSGGDANSLKAIRERARAALDLARAGKDPRAEEERAKDEDDKARKRIAASTIDQLLDDYLRLDVEPRKLRSAAKIKANFDRLVRPRIGGLSRYTMRRAGVIRMLDEIAAENGPQMADLALRHVRAAFNWYAVRDEEFRSPIVRGMSRVKPKEVARSRILDDQEIRDLWSALDIIKGAPKPFPSYVKCLLMLGVRRSELSHASWSEIVRDDGGITWLIPPRRSKSRIEHAVPLMPDVLRLFGKPKNGGYVFSSDGGASPFGGYSYPKAALDEAIAQIRAADGREPMKPWVFHDLRRSARSLMSRAGVSSDIAERCLGHVLSGVRHTYDRHSFLPEKTDALAKLAALVERIVSPPNGDNIALLAAARAARS
jgi:integrase